jgi:transcriptional regulator with AAA-type ATPase domain
MTKINQQPPPRSDTRLLLERRSKQLYSSLDIDQKHLYKLAMQSKSLFITGEPGTGKSFLGTKLYQGFRLALSEDQIAITGIVS